MVFALGGGERPFKGVETPWACCVPCANGRAGLNIATLPAGGGVSMQCINVAYS